MKLEIGYNHSFEIRKYQYPFDKLAGTKILYLSDFSILLLHRPADFGNCRYFISKGLGDTFPVRYNCPKDSILVEINTSDAHFPQKNKL